MKEYVWENRQNTILKNICPFQYHDTVKYSNQAMWYGSDRKSDQWYTHENLAYNN